MFRIGYSNNSGFFNTQCQQSFIAHLLGLFFIQSTISIDPIIAEHGDGHNTDGTKSLQSNDAAECINTRPRKFVFHDRFSISFCPEHIRYAQGFLTVNAFIFHLMYDAKLIDLAFTLYFSAISLAFAFIALICGAANSLALLYDIAPVKSHIFMVSSSSLCSI